MTAVCYQRDQPVMLADNPSLHADILISLPTNVSAGQMKTVTVWDLSPADFRHRGRYKPCTGTCEVCKAIALGRHEPKKASKCQPMDEAYTAVVPEREYESIHVIAPLGDNARHHAQAILSNLLKIAALSDPSSPQKSRLVSAAAITNCCCKFWGAKPCSPCGALGAPIRWGATISSAARAA